MWAINIVLGRFIAGTIPPATLSMIRWFGAAAIIAPFAWPHVKRDWPVIRANPGILIVLSLTGVTLYNMMAYFGLQYTEAINALLMQSTAPLLIGLWSLILFRDRLSAAQLAGIAISLLGVVVIITRGNPAVFARLALNPGDLGFVSALAIYALYAALLRKRPAIHFLSFLAVTVVAGAMMLIPFFIAEFAAGLRMHPTPAAFAVLAYVVVFPSIVAYIFFNRGVELIGANRTGPFFHLIPVFGSLIAIIFLGERPQWFHGAGYLLILAGIAIAQRKSPPPPPA